MLVLNVDPWTSEGHEPSEGVQELVHQRVEFFYFYDTEFSSHPKFHPLNVNANGFAKSITSRLDLAERLKGVRDVTS